MAGNSIGKIFKVTTFGESHGKALGCIVDGIPPGMPLNETDIQHELNRRRPGNSNYTTQRREPDEIKILSGIFNNITTGTSLGMMIFNMDYRSQDYNNIKDTFRPGHADFTYENKYGLRDYRGGGRSSARETVMRVAAGAIAKKYLRIKHGIIIKGYLSQIGDIKCELKDWKIVEHNPFFCPDPDKLHLLDNMIRNLKKTGNSVGAKITVIAENVICGIGEPVFDRLDADLAHALMSINAVKGIEIGDGFNVVSQKGNESRDEIQKIGFISNKCGGILGGISNGNTIIVNLAMKPTSSIMLPCKTITNKGKEVEIITKGRHDPCVGLRAVPIAEAMMSIVLMDHLLRYRGQCYDEYSRLKKI